MATKKIRKMKTKSRKNKIDKKGGAQPQTPLSKEENILMNK